MLRFVNICMPFAKQVAWLCKVVCIANKYNTLLLNKAAVIGYSFVEPSHL